MTTVALIPVAYDREHAAAAVGLSTRELDRAVEEGRLRRRYRGSKPLYLRSDLEEFVQSLPDERP